MTSPFQEKITKVYNALTNKINSSISTHNNSSSAHSSLLSLKANISDLGAIAFSNDYTDLDNQPSIPSSTSNLINDGDGNYGNFVGEDQLGSVAFSNSYDDLDNKPADVSDFTDAFDTPFTPKSHTHGNLQNDGKVGTSNNASKNVVTDSNGKITTEAKPTIPSASTTVPSADTSSGSYGSGTSYARSNHTHPKSSLYAEATHNHTKSQITDFPSIPSKTSDLTNDSNFISTSSTNGLIKNDGSIDTSSYITSSAITTHNSSSSSHQDLRNSKISYGQVDSTSTSTVFTATVPNLNELVDGTTVMLRNGYVTSAEGFTLEINGLGAKPVYSNLANATRDTTIFNINYTMLFVYDSTRVDGGCWICYRGYDSNTNTVGYQIRTNSTPFTATDKGYKYRLWLETDGNKYMPVNTSTSTNATANRSSAMNTREFWIGGKILYNATNGTTNANATMSTTTLWQQYTITLGYSFNNTGSALTLTLNEPLYMVAKAKGNGKAQLNTPYYTQTLPSTEDGLIYIYLGHMYSATALELALDHPVYEYKNNSIRLYQDTYSIDEVDDLLDGKSDTNHTHTKSQITDFPTIPSKTSDLTNDSHFISTSSTSGLIKNDGSIDTSSYITSSAITTHNSNSSAHSSLFSGKANSVHNHSTSDITDFPAIPRDLEDLTDNTGILHFDDYIAYDDMSGVPLSDFNNDITKLEGASGYTIIQEDEENGTQSAFNEKLIYDYGDTDELHFIKTNGDDVNFDDIILEGDSRLTNARTPTSHSHSKEDIDFQTTTSSFNIHLYETTEYMINKNEFAIPSGEEAEFDFSSILLNDGDYVSFKITGNGYGAVVTEYNHAQFNFTNGVPTIKAERTEGTLQTTIYNANGGVVNTEINSALIKIYCSTGALSGYFSSKTYSRKATWLDMIYPIGSIYISTLNRNPSLYFGGEWEQIQDRFLLASSSTYTVGTTGGEASVTLTANQSGVPQHTHQYSDYNTTYTLKTTSRKPGTSTAVNYGTSLTEGGGATTRTSQNNTASDASEAHNNMPPYLAVSVWERIT